MSNDSSGVVYVYIDVIINLFRLTMCTYANGVLLLISYKFVSWRECNEPRGEIYSFWNGIYLLNWALILCETLASWRYASICDRDMWVKSRREETNTEIHCYSQ